MILVDVKGENTIYGGDYWGLVDIEYFIKTLLKLHLISLVDFNSAKDDFFDL